VTQTSQNGEEEEESGFKFNQLQLFSDSYMPDSERTVGLNQICPKAHQQNQIYQTHGTKETAKNFEDVLNTPEAAIEVSSKKDRDVQFYFLINPKSGSGLGQSILEKNPKPFKFTSKFWEILPFCSQIRNMSINFISTERTDKIKTVFKQISNISRISLSKNID